MPRWCYCAEWHAACGCRLHYLLLWVENSSLGSWFVRFFIEVVALLLFFLEHQSSKVVQFVQRACRCLKTTHGRFMVHKTWSYWRFDIWNLQVSNWFHFSCRACRVWRNHQKIVLVLRHICILSTFPISNSLGVFQKRGEFTLSDVLELTLNDGMPKWSQSRRSAKLSKNSHVVDVLHVFSGSLHVQCFGLAVSVGTMEFQARTSGFWGYWGNADESFGAYDSCIYLSTWHEARDLLRIISSRRHCYGKRSMNLGPTCATCRGWYSAR